MPICLLPPISFRLPTPLLPCVRPSRAKASIGAAWRQSSIARDARRQSKKTHARRRVVSEIGRDRTLEQALTRRCLTQRFVAIELRFHPTPQPLGFEHSAVTWIIVVHGRQRLR